ncbi:trafficking protein particle complex subunit, putative [Entamoeba invadens IP1]|uniref:trafficking protein particle complex subunit, putative n=1 Tax=Entamoeba invadens IP1 TaxID=370355 RepID=UPI0002C3D0B1|nr:trafficking protein particle complex subunit, putative [Entamoeba invadens IP1]ELP93970.1 trafficking protein particle complex subunit, putative [Entamoeba invadens IP1]|eukprot:XP_004260741.1 trafficking protein particle complex subunit, putative [Entamoeba invadens IP1]
MTLYIYSETGVCMYNYSFIETDITEQQLTEHKQFISGLIQSITNFCDCINPSNAPTTFESFNTDTYKFHYFQTPTNLRFVLFTDNCLQTYTDWLKEYFDSCYVVAVAKNPMFSKSTEQLKCPLLDELTRNFFKQKSQN